MTNRTKAAAVVSEKKRREMGSDEGPVAAGDGHVSAVGSTGTMRAIVQDAYGGSDSLRLAQIETPVLSKHEVLLRVHAAGLDRGTWHLMTGRPYLLRLAFGIRAPKNPVPGRDVAGTVVAVGPAVTKFSEGDEVFGIAPGSFAEFAVASEDKLALKPGNVSFEQAAVVPISGVTALQALDVAGPIERGQKILVIGASGGVGSYAVQLAKSFGAEVTGVCSAEKFDLVRSFGADHVIDYATDDFAEQGQNYDIILDIAGNPSISRLRRALTRTGTAVIVGGEGGDSLTGGMGRQLRARFVSLLVRHRLTTMLSRERGSDVARLADLIAAGEVAPSLDRTYPLERAQEAMQLFESGNVRGKVAITVAARK